MYDNMEKDYVSEEYKKYLISHKRFKSAIRVSRIVILILIFVLWEFAANNEWIDPFIMSQPSKILYTLTSMAKDGSLFIHTGVTVYETLVGFVIGTLLGSLIAISGSIKCFTKNCSRTYYFSLDWGYNKINYSNGFTFFYSCNYNKCIYSI